MKLISSALMLPLLFSTAELLSQELDLEALQQNVSIFSGIVEESLELDQATGIFGNRVGGVEGIYLHGQGVVLEIRTPLANKRKQMGFSSLGRAMRSINRSNPFATLSAQESGSRLTVDSDSSLAEESSIERMASIDYSLVVNSAIQQAAAAARSLRTTGAVDETAYAVLQQELDGLRAQTQEKMAELRAMVATSMAPVEPAAVASTAATESSVSSSISNESSSLDLKAQFNAFMAGVEPLKQQALAKAAELQALSEQAQTEYAAQLDADITSFQTKLFSTLCTYGATLRELPSDENLSIILDDLGEETERPSLTDKVHVVSKNELLKCQSGDINAAELLAQSISYDY